MPTNLAIDDDLLDEALRLGRHRTKRETVNEALARYVERLKRLQLADLLGKIDIDPAYDHKAGRGRS